MANAARSYGVALDNCTVPGNKKDDRVPRGKAELGLGIHGEPGVQTIDFTDAASLASTLVQNLMAGQSCDQVMLLNNLGNTTPLEMQVMLNALLQAPDSASISHVVGPAQLMTSLDMHGVSVSMLPARAPWVAALQAPVACAAWPGCDSVSSIDVQPMPKNITVTVEVASHDEQLSALINDSCDAFMAMLADLNALDAKTGDGDTGTTVASAARSLKSSIDKLPLADSAQLFRAMSDQLSVSMGGSSGVLLAILFSAASDAARTGKGDIMALREGLTRMMNYGGAELGDRTMVDALLPALDSLISDGDIQAAALAARAGAQSTSTMTRARSGRSAYVPAASLQGVTDPGAEAVARFFEMLVTRA